MIHRSLKRCMIPSSPKALVIVTADDSDAARFFWALSLRWAFARRPSSLVCIPYQQVSDHLLTFFAFTYLIALIWISARFDHHFSWRYCKFATIDQFCGRRAYNRRRHKRQLRANYRYHTCCNTTNTLDPILFILFIILRKLIIIDLLFCFLSWQWCKSTNFD